jgi:CIC family chloride channel protein
LQRLNTAEMRLFFVRWVPIGLAVGAATGGLVALLHIVILDWAWGSVRGLYATSPWLMWVVPPTGFLLAALLVRGLNPRRYSAGTEEVLNAYHTPGAQIRSWPFLRRSLGSLTTIGAGGSAGLEGAAILSGAWFASFLVRRIRPLLFDEEDRRVLILVGAAAGVAAVFRAPFTGLLFSLEVPYKGDLAKNAFVPGLIASASSYVTFSLLVDVHPLFSFAAGQTLTISDLATVGFVGLLCGILAWAFVQFNRIIRSVFRHPKVPWEIGALGGGLMVGALGWVGLQVFGAPVSLGPGYELMQRVFELHTGLQVLLVLLLLKVLSTVFTLGTWGIGGIFFQSFIIGGLAGGTLHAVLAQYGLAVGGQSLFVTAGMASFLTAVYKTPIAATAFVAEATASADYLVPAFLAAAVAYVVSGSAGISENQLAHFRVRYDSLEGLTVRDAMQGGVVTVPKNLTIDEFLNEWVLRYRHVAYPVTDKGQLVGWITLEHASAFPPEARILATVSDGMSKTIPMCHPDEPLLDVMRRMQQQGQSRILVGDPEAKNKLVGILSESDLLRLVELRSHRAQT